MAKIGLFYGSTTGNTVKGAELIRNAFGADNVDLVDVGIESSQELKKYDVLILGTSTWHWGGLQDEWALFEDYLTRDILKGKKVAFFGLGDQKRYPDHFVDGMGLLYEKVKPLGVKVVGLWPKEGYNYEASAAELGEHLVGLALDEDSEPQKTEERINQWVRQLKNELGMK
ncbi:MAG: flavodoxin [Phycisphaerales bacterium]